MFAIMHSMRTFFGTNLDKVSAYLFGKLTKIPGGNVRIHQGFGSILAPLVRDLPRENIRFNKTVCVIHWSQDEYPRVTVVTKDGDKFYGDFVIITVPLGVLKEKCDTMFVPKLPKTKRDAINSLGVGHVNKVYLDYVRPWWVPGQTRMKIAWKRDELEEWTSWTKGIGTIREVPGSTHVLTFDIAGPEAVEMETISPEEVAIEFTKLMRKFTGDRTVPYPNNIIMSTWSTDPNFRCGRTYMSVNSTPGQIKDLYQPSFGCSQPETTPALLFAGEHTSYQSFGMVHGAMSSGLREADRILKCLQRQEMLEKRQKQREKEELECECKRKSAASC